MDKLFFARVLRVTTTISFMAPVFGALVCLFVAAGRLPIDPLPLAAICCCTLAVGGLFTWDPDKHELGGIFAATVLLTAIGYRIDVLAPQGTPAVFAAIAQLMMLAFTWNAAVEAQDDPVISRR